MAANGTRHPTDVKKTDVAKYLEKVSTTSAYSSTGPAGIAGLPFA
jgi:hypothetical protein